MGMGMGREMSTSSFLALGLLWRRQKNGRTDCAARGGVCWVEKSVAGMKEAEVNPFLNLRSSFASVDVASARERKGKHVNLQIRYR